MQNTDDDLLHVQATMGSDLDTVLVYNLLRTHSYLTPFIDADLRQMNLTSAQLNVLLVLRAAEPKGLLMGEIGQQLVATKSNVTGLIDRLERQTLAVRTAHDDRRATVVHITTAGTALLDRVAPAYAERLAELAGCLSDQEKRTLVRLLTKFRRALRHRRREHP
jgi:MarR family transcriptional regulator, 2-MHQ and catechol-resistance regulon repressor